LVHEQTKPGEELNGPVSKRLSTRVKARSYHTTTSLEDVLFEESGDLVVTLSGLKSNSGTDGLDLADDERVVALKVEDGAKNFSGFLLATLLCKPSRGLGRLVSFG